MQRCKVAKKRRFPRFPFESEKLSKVPRGHLVGPGIYIYLSLSFSLSLFLSIIVNRSFTARAKAAERPASKGKPGRRVRSEAVAFRPTYIYYTTTTLLLLLLLLHHYTWYKGVNAIPLPDSRFLDRDSSTQIWYTKWKVQDLPVILPNLHSVLSKLTRDRVIPSFYPLPSAQSNLT